MPTKLWFEIRFICIKIVQKNYVLNEKCKILNDKTF